MTVRESKFAWRTLLRLFKQDFDRTTYGPKFTIGLALAASADDEVIADVIELFQDPRHGPNRVPGGWRRSATSPGPATQTTPPIDVKESRVPPAFWRKRPLRIAQSPAK